MYSGMSDGVSAELAGARAGYRREFDEMESRIRKCERQRAELELQFGELMRERAECERAAARAKKQRHKRLMEAERQRAERNESILRMLNKIDQQAASLAAKTDRLKMLKTQYEMYLMRTYSSAQPSVFAYCPPMIAAPPSMSPKAPQSPSKSCFAQYLSDLTHQQQQASIDPIPPPTALSNYLATQQKSFIQSSSYTAPIERPYSRMGVPWAADEALRRQATAGSEVVPLPMANGGAKAKRFEMSNEDFIRYIDSEVLKEPIPTVSVVAPSPEGIRTGEQVRGAYLEDAGMSEDEQRPVAIDRLTEDVEQFSIVAKETDRKNVDWKDVDVDEPPVRRPETKEDTLLVAADHAGKNQPLVEESIHNEPDYPAEEQDHTSKIEPPPGSEVTALYKGMDEGHASDETVDRMEPQVQKHSDVPQAVVEQRPVEGSTLVQFKEPEYIPDYPGEQQDATYQQQTVYGSEEPGSSQAYNEQLYEKSNGVDHIETLAHAVEERPVEDIQLPNALQSNQEYNPELYPSNNEVYTEAQHLPLQPAQQVMEQPTAGGQRWFTARQAMRSKAFPGATSKPPSPDMKLPDAASYEPTYETGTAQKSEDQVDPNVVQGHYEGGETSGPVENIVQNTEVYPEYTTGTNEQSYYTPNTAEEPTADPQQTVPAVGYPDDGMGQPVEYQTGTLEDGQQAGVYQYQQADGQQATYQEGQYTEGSSSDPMQYQYAEGADHTVAPYGTQEGYHDPNQQYQYDQSAYYDQQQQGYEGRYYSEDPQQQQDDQQQQQQQQQQQYYMEGPNQQQQGQYEQQDLSKEQQQQNPPVDHYQPDDQGNYPTDAQYEPSTNLQPVSTDGADQTSATDQPTSEPSKVVVSQTTPDAPSVEATPASDVAVPPKENPEKNSYKGKQTNAPKSSKKDTEPASDTPTASTVNDESDFDFSTQ